MKKNYQFYLVVLFLSALFVNQGFSKQFIDLSKKNYGLVCKVWDTDNGLSSNNIKDILEDRNGFIWIATDNSLTRFDGRNFTIYNSENTSDLINGACRELYLNNDNNLWFSSESNGLIVKRKNNFSGFNSISGLSSNNIISITGDDSGNVWIGTLNAGLNYFSNGVFTVFDSSNSIIPESISELCFGKKGELYIGTNGDGLYVYHEGSFQASPINEQLPSLWIKNIFIDSKQKLWIATTRGVYVFDNGNPVFRNELKELQNDLITSINEDSDGNTWIASYNRGLFVLHNRDLIKFTKENGLSSDQITSITVVNEGILVGTTTGGLNLLSSPVLNVIGNDNGLTSEFVNSIFEDRDGSLLIGTSKGLFRLEFNNMLPIVKKLPVLGNNHIYAINRDNKGSLLVGQRVYGLTIFSGQSVKNYNSSNGLKVNFVRAVYVDHDNSIWIGTNGAGIGILNNDQFRFIDKTTGLSNNFVSFIHKTKSNKFLVGTSGGGLNIIQDEKIIEIIDTSSGLRSNIVSSVYEGDDGVIWLSTNGGGLTRIEGSSINNFTTADGLYHDKLFNIAADKTGLFWCTTPSGIFSINRELLENYRLGNIDRLECKSFGLAEGMLVERCTAASPQTSITDSKGNVYVSTFKGMVYFDPSSVIPKPGEIHIIIDELIVDTKKIDFDSVIVIPPSPERLEINYAAASLNNSKEIRFKYIMNGMERQWVDAADNMKATYTQLPYGQYTFRVKAYTKDNETNYAETFFSIYIKPNFWETPWFNAGVILLAFSTVGGSIRLFYKSKYKRKLERLQAQHALEKERIRISKDMHDELGSSLTKMSLLSEIAKKFSNNPETIRKYLADISETGRNVANTMDEIVWAVNPRNDRLDKTIYYIAQFVEEYLAIAGVNLNLQLPDFIPDYFLSAEQRHNLFMVIKEAVNNIVKHSKAKNVEFTIVTSRDDLEIKIKDDGAGIDFEKIGEFSNGLSNMKKRITDINGIITISNIKPSGVLLGIKISHKSVM